MNNLHKELTFIEFDVPDSGQGRRGAGGGYRSSELELRSVAKQ